MILSSLVIGFDKIEPVVVANVAIERNVILVGRHGTCKSTIARELAKGYGGSFVIYDATKDDIISICGIPKTKVLEEGRLEFAIGDRTIWDKSLIVIDEIGRATKENQNILLEILQERTCFGKKLPYRSLIATMNPESYAASLRLDEALMDRFSCVINVPDFHKKAPKENIKAIISMNIRGRDTSTKDNIADSYLRIRQIYEDIKGDHKTFNAIVEYVGNVLEILIGQQDKYISPRRFTMLAEEIMIIGAYYKYSNDPDFLIKGAEKALDYTITAPLRIAKNIIDPIHKNFKHLLKIQHTTPDRAVALRTEIAGIRGPKEKTSYIIKNLKDISIYLKADEVTNLMGAALDFCKEATTSMIIDYYEALKDIEGFDEGKRHVKSACREVWDNSINVFLKKISSLRISSPEEHQSLTEVNSLLKQLQSKDVLDSNKPEIKRFRSLLFNMKNLELQNIKEVHSTIFG